MIVLYRIAMRVPSRHLSVESRFRKAKTGFYVAVDKGANGHQRARDSRYLVRLRYIVMIEGCGGDFVRYLTHFHVGTATAS